MIDIVSIVAVIASLTILMGVFNLSLPLALVVLVVVGVLVAIFYDDKRKY